LSITAASADGSPASVDVQFADQRPGTLRIGSGGPIYTISKYLNPVAVPLGTPFNPSRAFHYDFLNPGSRMAEPISGIMLYIDPAQDVPAGIYRENLDIQYQCSGAGTAEIQSGVLPIEVNVPSTLTASFSGGSAYGTIDFGDFATPAQTVMVNVYSTGPYSLSINSMNAQRMKMTTAPAGAAGAASAQIPYTVSFAGAPVTSTESHFPRTGTGGSQLPLSVTTEPTAGNRAGVYHDVITMTFTPRITP
jgi:hypothetical protein